MFQGSVVSIHIAPSAEAGMVPLAEVTAVAGKGLDGDRYFNHEGSFSANRPDQELTLIEEEAIEAFRLDTGEEFAPGASRRNITTRGVPLNHLVGREFLIGEVRARGIKLCEPCSHLARLTTRSVLPGLVHRGGLRAQILTDGVIRAGDPVKVAEQG